MVIKPITCISAAQQQSNIATINQVKVRLHF